jgi:hypothetical protein
MDTKLENWERFARLKVTEDFKEEGSELCGIFL